MAVTPEEVRRKMRLRLFSMFAVIAALAALSTVVPVRADYLLDELLVRFKKGASEHSRAALHSSNGTSLVEKIEPARVHRVKLPPGLTVDKAAAAYRRSPLVEYAGPNHKLYLDYHPNDEHYQWYQWALYSGGEPRYDIHAPEAWDVTTGSSSIIIAVIDTGVWEIHDDLYVPSPNSKVLIGYNAIDNSSDTNDYSGHGTLVSSIAAALTDNYIGMAGVAWNARILPIKFIEYDGGLEADAAEGIYWAVQHGAKILNMSFGAYDDVPVLAQAIADAWNQGCLSVCSSGNDDLNALHYPSAYDQALAVGASDEYDRRWIYDDPYFGDHGGSNYGPWLDVMAPGSNILGAYIEEDWIFGLGYFTIGSGTSAASPHVSGTAALIWTMHPTWTNKQVFCQLVDCCDDIGAPGWDIETAAGRINAYKAVTLVQAQPATLGDAKALPNGVRVTLTGKAVTCPAGMITDRIYVEETTRTSGMLVDGAASPPSMSEGSRVTVTGILGEKNGERAILNATFYDVLAGQPLKPMHMPGRYLGGGAAGPYQPGVDGGIGLNNLGLLVSCAGVVTARDFTHFYIDDRSPLNDGSGNTGVRVAWNGSKPKIGDYVVVTGISGCEIPPETSLRVRTLRVRQASDIYLARR